MLKYLNIDGKHYHVLTLTEVLKKMDSICILRDMVTHLYCFY